MLGRSAIIRRRQKCQQSHLLRSPTTDRYKPEDFAIFSQQPTQNSLNTHDKENKTEFVAALEMHQSFSLLPADIRMGILQAILNQ